MVSELRGERNRLGFSAMFTGVRFLGVFPGAADEVPRSVLETLREQLGLGQAVSLDGYFEGGAAFGTWRRSAPASASRSSATTPEPAFA